MKARKSLAATTIGWLSVATGAVGVSGCDAQLARELALGYDDQVFSWLGQTVFRDVAPASAKQVHLDKGLLVGHDVTLEGEVSRIGPFTTYLILNTSDGRVLVVLNRLRYPDPLGGRFDRVVGKRVAVLGQVQYGKKSFPHLVARAIYERA